MEAWMEEALDAAEVDEFDLFDQDELFGPYNDNVKCVSVFDYNDEDDDDV